MTATKMETASERYRRIKEDRLKDVELFDFESPSGMVWKLRRPNLPQFIATGAMPMSFAGTLAKAVSDHGGNEEEAFLSLNWNDQVRTVDLINKIVRYCAVEPRIVDTPTQPNEIGYDEMELDDYNAIASWAMSGGGDAEALNTFRSAGQ